MRCGGFGQLAVFTGTGIAVANNNRRVISEGLLFSKLLTIFDAFETAQIDFYNCTFSFYNCTIRHQLHTKISVSYTHLTLPTIYSV